MSLETKIAEGIKTAMKAKNKEQLEALRAVKAALLLEKTSGNEKGFTEDDEIKLIQRLVKQRKDSAELYQQQNRADLAEKELSEVKFLEAYLPEQISNEELSQFISQLIQKTGASGMKDMGKVMGIASKELAGKAEGKLIAAKVKELLN